MPDGASLVRINRDDEAGLASLRGQAWDAVIDVTRQSGHARRAVRDGHTLAALWIEDLDGRWFAILDTTAARGAGLTTRPLEETLAAALEYEGQRTTPRAAGLTDDEERALRAHL